MNIIETLEQVLTTIREAQTEIINDTADFMTIDQLEDLLPMTITKTITIGDNTYLIENETKILKKKD